MREEEHNGQELDDAELEAELTIAAIEPSGRARRHDVLFRELLRRRRGYSHPSGANQPPA